MIVIPEADESIESFFARRGDGKAMLLINVVIDGEKTSVWENTTQNGAWRDKNGNEGRGKLIDHPNISVCSDTMSLSCTDATALTKDLAELSRLLPDKPVGAISRSAPEALEVLNKLMHGGVEIIRNSMGRDLTTSLFLKRRELGKRVDLLTAGELSIYARELLESFMISQPLYADLPELRHFTGGDRDLELPPDGGGRIRAWLKEYEGLNLAPDVYLGFVNYELKPLRVSKVVNWRCQQAGNEADPRRDSMDILLSCDRVPVHSEVKARGDSYCSSAFVQILYYGCVLANERQQRRLCGQFPQLGGDHAWLAVIAEARDEDEERGFDEDRIMTVKFLQHRETQEALRPFFHGVFIIVVRKDPDTIYSVVEEQTNMIVFGD